MSRIKVKIGDAEFDAEGEPDDIKAQYEAFLDMLQDSQQRAPAPPAGSQGLPPGQKVEIDDALKRVFDLGESGLISLKVLPRGDNAAADALLLLLFGYRKISGNESVFAVTLAKAAKKSGVIFERVDRAIEPHRNLVGRGGLRRGATYTINNQGIAEAEKMIPQLL
jgi:hypothetical protein